MRISGDQVVEIEFVRGRSSIGSANTCRVAMIENTAVMISEGRIIGTLMRVAIWISVHPSSVAASYSSLGTDFSEVYSTTMLNPVPRSEEHTSELQSRGHLVCRLLLEK